MPGYPENPNSPILESETRYSASPLTSFDCLYSRVASVRVLLTSCSSLRRGRNIQEISFDGTFKLGNFPAHDFFGDASFFLLDAPGVGLVVTVYL